MSRRDQASESTLGDFRLQISSGNTGVCGATMALIQMFMNDGARSQTMVEAPEAPKRCTFHFIFQNRKRLLKNLLLHNCKKCNKQHSQTFSKKGNKQHSLN